VLVDDGAAGTGVYGEVQGGKMRDVAFDHDEVAVVKGKGNGVWGGVWGVGASGGKEKNTTEE
jgi:hypothetical protein